MAARALPTVVNGVIRYPALTKPKNFDAAVSMLHKVINDWRLRVAPKLPFPIVSKSGEDVIRYTRNSLSPELKEVSLVLEKNLNVSRERAQAKGPQKDFLFPVELWKKVLPPEYVNAYKQYLDKRNEEVWERSDCLPIAKVYVEALNDLLPELEKQLDASIAAYHKLQPELEKLERRRRAIENNEITIEALFAENPDIAEEIADELERGDWSPEGNLRELEEADAHAHAHGHGHH